LDSGAGNSRGVSPAFGWPLAFCAGWRQASAPAVFGAIFIDAALSCSERVLIRRSRISVVRRIVQARDAGWTYDAIASDLAASNVLSPLGKPTWQASTVRRIYASATAEQVSA
jgi:hypothetical protein